MWMFWRIHQMDTQENACQPGLYYNFALEPEGSTARDTVCSVPSLDVVTKLKSAKWEQLLAIFCLSAW